MQPASTTYTKTDFFKQLDVNLRDNSRPDPKVVLGKMLAVAKTQIRTR